MFKRLREFRIIPMVYVSDCTQALNVAKALEAGGLPVMELMYRNHSDHEIIRHVRNEMPDFWIGAGGILNKDLLLRAIDAEARFVTSPGVNAETIQEAVKREFSFAPGVCTPSDIEVGLVNGVDNFQFFPAEMSGGAAMLQAIIEPFAHLAVELMPKGGITADNMAAYLQIPQVAAVSVDWIADPALIADEQWDKITANAKQALAGLTG